MYSAQGGPYESWHETPTAHNENSCLPPSFHGQKPQTNSFGSSSNIQATKIDSAFADLTASIVNQVDPHGTSQLAAKLKLQQSQTMYPSLTTHKQHGQPAQTVPPQPSLQYQAARPTQQPTPEHSSNWQYQATGGAPQQYHLEGTPSCNDIGGPPGIYQKRHPNNDLFGHVNPPRSSQTPGQTRHDQSYIRSSSSGSLNSSFQSGHGSATGSFYQQSTQYQSSPPQYHHYNLPQGSPQPGVSSPGYGYQQNIYERQTLPSPNQSFGEHASFSAAPYGSANYLSTQSFESRSTSLPPNERILQPVGRSASNPALMAAAKKIAADFDPFFANSVSKTTSKTSSTGHLERTEVVEDNLHTVHSVTKSRDRAKDEYDDTSSDSDEDSDRDDVSNVADFDAFDETSLAQVIPTGFTSEASLREFLILPIESSKLVKCIIMFDPSEKLWTFTNQSNGVRLMTAFKRKDGLKRLTTQMQFSINFSPRAIEDPSRPRSKYSSWKASKSEKDTYVAKVKSDVGGKHFDVYDSGLNPVKAAGPMHSRRELGAIKFEKLSHDAYRRKVRACVPSQGFNHRPQSKKEQIFERLAQGDNTVTPLTNHLPGKPMYLPRLSDFHGMAMQSSVKNVILHNPMDPEGDVIYVFGKTNKNMFNCYFKEPISPVMAFAIGLASIGSYVSPKS